MGNRPSFTRAAADYEERLTAAVAVMAPGWVVSVEPALPPEIPAVACVIRRVLVVSPLWRPTRDALRDWLCRAA